MFNFKYFLNKEISFLVGIFVIFVVFIVGVVLTWQSLKELGYEFFPIEFSERKKEVVFGSACNDLFDFPGSLDESEKRGECIKILKSRHADLENMGYKPEDCQFKTATGAECGGGLLGTWLKCTYICQ